MRARASSFHAAERREDGVAGRRARKICMSGTTMMMVIMMMMVMMVRWVGLVRWNCFEVTMHDGTTDTLGIGLCCSHCRKRCYE